MIKLLPVAAIEEFMWSKTEIKRAEQYGALTNNTIPIYMNVWDMDR